MPEKARKTLSQQAMEAEWQEVQAAQKDPRRFQPLYDRYYEGIFRFIYKRTADEALSGDLCAQVFLKALQKLQSYRFQGVPFSSWLYRIASNEIAQHYRKTAKNRVVMLEDYHVDQLNDEMGNTKQELEINLELMKEAIQQLNEKEVELIELRFFEQRPFAEVAEILGITENNAKVKTYRLLTKVRKIMLRQQSHTKR